MPVVKVEIALDRPEYKAEIPGKAHNVYLHSRLYAYMDSTHVVGHDITMVHIHFDSFIAVHTNISIDNFFLRCVRLETKLD